MNDKQYGHDDAREYEPYFSRHLMAMTAEDLHSKGEIACELAYRDARIAELKKVAEAARNWVDVHYKACATMRCAPDEEAAAVAALLGGGENG